MTKIHDNTVNIDLPKNKIRLKYKTNWIIILVLSFWTLFIAVFFYAILNNSYYPFKCLWNDWRISQNYEIIPDSYAKYECWDDVGDAGNIKNCGVIFNIGQYSEKKLNIRDENNSYSWFRFLTPDDLSLSGISPMVRNVNDPNRITFLFGIETLKIRFLTLLGNNLLLSIILFVCICGLYIWWRVLYWRIVPNDVSLKIVKIIGTNKTWHGMGYFYYGLKRAGVLEALKINPTVNSWVFTRPARTQQSGTLIRKNQTPIFLDNQQKFGLAIEAKQAGGGYLLDYNLTQLVLSKEDKKQLIVNIGAYIDWIRRNPEKLQEFDVYIEDMPETELEKTYNPPKE